MHLKKKETKLNKIKHEQYKKIKQTHDTDTITETNNKY